ncbi:serologically defined colon cancer antigen 3-like [Scleropages formosus]|uniref:Endosome-associated-trafficking regulator 1 n=1 Tax=Scleropages formosus TaxID=113540 RepID=A0A0P7TCS1_SCLFO|nr:endosome-associated-trafficking regulator 1 isoform X2 [Scleropages formosus]KPP58594.1 serologically defined colon cancer antigen 3-like [Scleropages formosus]
MSKRPTLIIEDDEHEKGTDDTNPFSFKEFMRSQNQCPSDEGCREETDCSTQKAFVEGDDDDDDEEEDDCFTMNISEPFFSDPAPFPQSLDNEAKKWTGSFYPSGTGFGLDSTLFSTMSNEDEGDTGPFWQDGGFLQGSSQNRASTGSYEADLENSFADVTYQNQRSNGESGGRDQQKLREENAQLRKQVKELLRRSEADSCRIQHLREELHKRKMQEEKEAQDLETMVHSVERNLQLMTKRAVKAENSVSKLKQEVLQLQGQLEVYLTENKKLRDRETTALNTMKQKAQLAAEHLSKAASNAESSIKQLLTGADTLYLVSQILGTIDSISDLPGEDR